MVKLTVDEILALGMLSGLSRSEAAKMMLAADDAKKAAAKETANK